MTIANIRNTPLRRAVLCAAFTFLVLGACIEAAARGIIEVCREAPDAFRGAWRGRA